MTARAASVLDRFPQHLAATDPGKRFGTVVTALAQDLDTLTRQAQGVRSAHRVGEAPTLVDLAALAALHGIDDAAGRPLTRRLSVLRTAAATEPPEPDLLADLLAVPAAVLAELDDLPAAVAAATRHRARVDLHRGAVLGVVRAHRLGNATPTALLHAAAAFLGLGVEAVQHEAAGWWHLARCRDRIRLEAPPPADGDGPPPAGADLTPRPDVLALEENPFRPADIEPVPHRTGQRRRILRGGLEDVDVTVRVVGTGNRTVRPVVVDLRAGRGLVFEGAVPDGAVLDFGWNGRVTLDGTDVTGSAWAFTGAVFADESSALPAEDFRFADGGADVPGDASRAASFAVAGPVPGAFDSATGLPHGASAVAPHRLPRGESRWAALVRVARAGGRQGEPAPPRTVAGAFDASVFAAAPGAAPEPCLLLGFLWEEREPFAVRVLLPRRLAAADDEGGTLLRGPLARLLDRHRAAGVHLRVEYADPRWTLGRGVVRDAEDDALGVVLAGTELWPDGTPQPGPG